VALRTPIDDCALQLVAAQFGLEMVRHAYIDGGVENTSYAVTTNQGQFVFTILGRRTMGSAASYAAYLRSLADHGLPVPTLRGRPGGGHVAAYRGKPVIATVYVDGRCGGHLTDENLFALGAILAELHDSQVECDLPPSVRLRDDDLEQVDHLTDPAFAEWFVALHDKVRGVVERRDPPVPTHGDLFCDNVVVTPGRDLMLIDWEDGARDLALVDVAMAILGLCAEARLVPSRVDRLLTGYRSRRTLEGDTRDLLHATIYAGLVVTYRRYLRNDDCVGATDPRSHRAMQYIVDSLACVGNRAGLW
jgi:homoserine kinase type II